MSVDMNNMPGRGRAPSDPNAYDMQMDGQSENRSPLSQFNFLKNLNDRKQNKDGQPQKRRGPKPDSKPALTRRQELNRQAQRTHRERKEQYIKALEQELLRIKELYGNTTRERDSVVHDNRRLKELLAAHGIPFDSITPSSSYNATMPSYTGSSSGSVSGSFRQDSNTTTYSPGPMSGQRLQSTPTHQQSPSAAQLPQGRLDYDQLGIDFVLALERPCMDHIQYLVVRSHNQDGKVINHPMERPDDHDHEHMSGHALMATCPPMSHIMEKPGEPYPYKMPDLPKPDLMKLLEASAKLPGMDDGELTPIKAWMAILRSERAHMMTARDFEMVKADLMGKVRCYGFGAVLEDFEIQDALNNVFAGKDSVPAMNGFSAPTQQVAA